MTKRKNFKYFLILLVLLTVKFSYAQEEIETDRPDQAEGPVIVQKGMLQLEHGFAFEKESDIKNFSFLSTLVRYGVNENFELRLELDPYIGGLNSDKKFELNPVKFGIKSKLINGSGSTPDIAFVGSFGFPKLASKDNDINYIAADLILAAESKFSEDVKLGYNIGLQLNGISPVPVYFYAVSFDFNITEKAGGYTELYGYSPQNGNMKDIRFDCGLTYLLNKDLQADVSLGKGLTKESDNFFAGCGISYRFRLK